MLLILLSCNIQDKQKPLTLANTKWEYKVAEGCVNYIYFNNDSTYEDYNCEIDYPFSGRYQIRKDTIYLIEIDLASNLPNEKRRVIKSKTKGILKNDRLKFFDRENIIDGKWIKSGTKSIEEILYKKTEKH